MSANPAFAASAFSMEAFYVDHHGWLLGWLRRKVGDSHSAADFAQDTFMRVLASRSRPQITEPRAFLTTIAKGLVIDQWRRQEIERAYHEALCQQPEHLAPSPESRLIILETLTRIDRLLDGLKPRVREAFFLAQLEGLPYTTIAERMEVTTRSVERYMAEALYQCHLALAQ